MAKIISFPVINLPATGRSIERHRKAANLSVRDLQTYFGFEYPQAVYKWQRGECLPSVDNLLALARLLRVRMEDLLVYEDQEVPLIFGETCIYFSLHRLNRCIFYTKFFCQKRKKPPSDRFLQQSVRGSLNGRSVGFLYFLTAL